MGKQWLFISLLIVGVTCQKMQKIAEIQSSISQSEPKPGETVNITCRAIGFDNTEYINWFKEVVDDQGKLVMENVATNHRFEQPYDKIERYSAMADLNSDPAMVQLTLKDVKPEDSGIYQCTSPDHEKSDAVTLKVKGSMQNVWFNFNGTVTGETLSLEEGTVGKLSCYTNGSVHVPKMTMVIGEEKRDISQDFVATEHNVLHCEQKDPAKTCLLHTTSSMEFANQHFAPTYQHDGQHLQCWATLTDQNNQPFDSKSADLLLNISYVPHVECPYEVEYLPESTDKTVQCRIFANPALNLSTVHWEWLAGKDSITLSPGDEAYSSVSSSISQVSDRQHDVTLHFGSVKTDHFGQYILHVENERGESIHTLNVKEKVKDPNTGGSTSDVQLMTSSTFLVTLFTITSRFLAY